LLAKADALDAQWIASGHYARAEAGVLRRGLDPRKDQSYFLWGLDPAVVRRLLLPVGGLTKTETRARARDLGLDVVAEKVESQDICFVPDGDHTKIIAKRLGADAPALARGPFVLSDGTVAGWHEGYARFTVGQRRGVPGGFTEAMYVTAIRPHERAVVIGPRAELLGRGVIARELNWIAEPRTVGDRVFVQVRHRATPVPADIVRVNGEEIELALDAPVAAIAPGQSLVLYDGDMVIGGGVIEAARAQLPVLAA
jgi:tRNA-specific 2-thiouridylase